MNFIRTDLKIEFMVLIKKCEKTVEKIAFLDMEWYCMNHQLHTANATKRKSKPVEPSRERPDGERTQGERS